jgi:Protein tyrosine and serine/threonine kinase
MHVSTCVCPPHYPLSYQRTFRIHRYMAPEVATHQFYSLPADVYSFGIMLWEIVTLIKPFEDMSRSEHMDIVIRGRVRPWIDSTCGSVALRKLMQSAWDRTPAHRPNYCKIIKILVEETNSDSVWGCESNSENKQPPWYNRGVAGFLRGCNTKSPSKQQRGSCAA